MATIDDTNGTASNTSGAHPALAYSNRTYSVENTIDLAVATTTKGSALASGDVIQAIFVPRNTIIHGAVAEVIALTENTGALVNIDIAGPDTDDFVDGGAFGAADSTGWLAIGSNGLLPFGANSVAPTDTSDYIDCSLELSGATTAATGKIRVVAFLSDVSETSKGAAAVRDTLA